MFSMTNQEFIDSIKMDGEEFKPVIGYEDLYMVSSCGRVVSLGKYVNNRFQDVYKEPRLLNPHENKSRSKLTTPSTMLSKNKKQRKFHLSLLVAIHFVPNPDNRTFLRFKDGNNQNCTASNLEWGVVKDRRKQYDTTSLEGEVWMDIPGYEGLYKASTKGRIYSYRSRKFLVECRTGRGLKSGDYKAVTLVNIEGDKKRYSIHRLVATCFIPNPKNLPCIDHINAKPYDNRVENLRWCTYTENNMNPITYERMKPSIKAMNEKSKKKVVSLKEGILIKKYQSMQQTLDDGFSPSCISACCRGISLSHKGYKWMYLSDYETLTNMSKNSLSTEDN